MTYIRKHGFESDAQWREYQHEIEEATGPTRLSSINDQRVLDELAGLRAEIVALREQVRLRRTQDSMTRWQRVGGAMTCLLLVSMVGR
ncbi:hypothetical protein [Shinella sp.]|uniref:hypothetical protein n=1 Tax=Shinella sp. TaxID=1870904 RepID=UPI0028A702DF|nr:hypothetical protein [Shinella sp.]